MKRRRPRPEDFTIAWICALHVELTAAKLILDEEYEHNGEAAQYTLGRIGQHNVIVGCLPAGTIGLVPAARVAAEMQFKFPSLRTGLLVGIGGGVPSSEVDIRLGDVVISVPQENKSGVVQYDFGKTVSGRLQRTGALNRPSAVLLTAVTKLRSKIAAGESSLMRYLESTAHLSEFTRSYAGPDVLFFPSYSHVGGPTCSGCDEKMIIRRPSRDGEHVVVHYGTIASGNQVIKDALERDRLSTELGGVLCFEMEAAGLMNTLECIVVRGICDYADSHKNKKWQPFAAAMAAACAKEILSYVPLFSRYNNLELVELRQSSTSDGNDMSTNEPDRHHGEAVLSSIEPSRSSTLTSGQKRRFLDALKFKQINSRYTAIKQAHIKTCRWLLTKSEYREWLGARKLAEHHGLLWIKGNPGTGKSTIMKFVFENTRTARENTVNTVVISFFFNARGDELEKSVQGMYRSLLVQLLEKVPEIQDVFGSIRLTALDDDEVPLWTVETLQSLFKCAVEKLRQRSLVCFIDALDECDEDEVRCMVSFLEQLGDLAVNSQLQLRVCFSSRHYPHIVMRNGIELLLEDQEGHQQDIVAYVHNELKCQHHNVDKIRTEIIKKASGIFLWVFLVIPILNKAYAAGKIRALKKRLDEIPEGLNELFRDILTRDNQNMEELILCLQWILFAKRPLKKDELYFAILAGIESEGPRGRDPLDDTDEVIECYILNASKGLAEVTKVRKSEDKTIQFIHESVKDFLLKENGLSSIASNPRRNFQGYSHERLKKCCLNYMKIDIIISQSLSKASSKEAIALRKRISNGFPFLEYSVRNVLYHADMAEENGITQKDFVQDFPLADWVKFDNIFQQYEVRCHTANVTFLYILAENNLPNLIRIHPCVSSFLKMEGERYGSPLFVSFAFGSEAAIQAFLDVCEANQSPNQPHKGCHRDNWNESRQTNFGRDFKFTKKKTVLSYAAEYGNARLFSYLLSTGNFIPNARDQDGCTPIFRAALSGHNTIVKLLLEAENVDPNIKDNSGCAPLLWAAQKGHNTIIKLLLEMGNIDLNIKDNDGCTPLLWAAEKGHNTIIKLLLEMGNVDPNIKDNWGNSAIFKAIMYGHNSTIKLLLEAEKVDPNIKDNRGRTPLLWAAKKGHDTIVNLLVEVGRANPNIKDNDGCTPLLLAARKGKSALVKVLLDIGKADHNTEDNIGCTPLSAAATGNHYDVCKLLIETGRIKINLEDLRWVVGMWDEVAARLLLGKIDVNWEDKNLNGSLLIKAANNQHENQAIVKLLLEMGNPDINVKDRWNRTPLSFAAGLGHKGVVQLLLQRGKADINIKDYWGDTPLSLAAGSGHRDVVKLLLETGKADVNITNSGGNTPLSLAVLRGEREVVKLLLETGKFDVNSKGYRNAVEFLQTCTAKSYF